MEEASEAYQEHLPALAKGAGINFFGALSGKILVLIFTLLIARALGPKQVGLYFLGLALVNLAAIPALLGLDSGIVRYVALFRGENDEKRIKGAVLSSLWIALPLSLVVATGLFFLADTISVGIFHKPSLINVLKIFSLSIPFLTVSTLFLAVTQAFKLMQYKVYAKDLADTIFRIVLTLVFLVLGWKLFGAVFATVISSVLVAAISFYYVNKFFPLFNSSLQSSLELKNLLGFSIPQTLSRMIMLGIIYTDTLMLGYFLSAEDVGIYNIAAKVALLGILVLDSFNTIFAPMISDLYNRKETFLLSSLFKTVTKWIFSFSFPLFLIFIFLPEPILATFGREFVVGSTVLMVLTFGQIINSVTGPAGMMILMSGRSMVQFLVNLTVFGLNIFLNYLLIPPYGILGAAIATATALSIMNFVRLVIVQSIMKMQPYRLNYLKPIFAGVITSVVVFWGLQIKLEVSPVLLLILLTTAFLVIYTAFLVLFGIDSEDRLVVRTIRRRLDSPNRLFNRSN